MKIQKTTTGFRRIIDIGVYSYFIYVDDNGANISNEEIIEPSQHFKHITFISKEKDFVFYGDDVFDYKEDIDKIVKKLKKINPLINITFFTKGKIKPIGIGRYDNIFYNVFLDLKRSGEASTDRLKEAPLKYFKESNSRFIFSVYDEDEIDEINIIITSFELKKEQIFIIPKDNIDKIKKLCKLYGYNICFYVEKDFFEVREDGQEGTTEESKREE